MGEFIDALLEAKQILCRGRTPARDGALRIRQHFVQLGLHMRALIEVFGTVCPCNSHTGALGIRARLPDDLVIDRRQSPVLLHPGADDMARLGAMMAGDKFFGSLVISGVRNYLIFQANKAYPDRSRWIRWNKCLTFRIP